MTTLDRLKAYRAKLKAAGRIKEAETVTRCIKLMKVAGPA